MSDLEKRRAELQAKKDRLRKIKEDSQNINKDHTNIGGVNLADKLINEKQQEEKEIQQQQQNQQNQQQQQDNSQNSSAQNLDPKKNKLKIHKLEDQIIKTQEKIMMNQEVQYTPEIDLRLASTIQQEKDEQQQQSQKVEEKTAEQQQVIQDKLITQPPREHKEIEKEFTEEDIKQITKSEDFLNFFNKTTKYIEKLLNSTDEVDMMENKFEQEVDGTDESRSSDPLIFENKFYDPQFCENRVVSVIKQSQNLPETILAGYSKNEAGNINDHVGVVLLWSQNLRNRPEFHCFSSSQVTSASFYPYNNSYILGGLHNGQVVVWDLRANSMPIQRSSQSGHTYPIYSLEVVGTQNAHNIVSVSNDGTLCTWDLKQLNQPTKKVQLTQNINSKTNNKVPVSCMDFVRGDQNRFFVGCEDWSFHSAMLHTPNNDIIQNSYSNDEGGHEAPISGIHWNSISDQSHYLSNLVLTSSFDWTVKLWNPSDESGKCLHTFEQNEDSVYDVQWNREYPCIFATGDGEGYIDIWDLQQDLGFPVGRHRHQDQQAINKIAWNQTGDKIYAGDSKGSVDLFSVKKKFLKNDPSKLGQLSALLGEEQE